MKRASAIAALVFLATACGYAADKHSAKVVFTQPTRVGQSTLPAGEYLLHWTEGTGEAALSITGNKSQVSVPVMVDPKGAGRESLVLHMEGGKTVVDAFTTKEALLTVKTSPAGPASASAK